MYKYIYIDDTYLEMEIGTINGIKQGGQIEVRFIKPGLWEQKITELTGLLQDYHGLIVDLRLNDMPYDDVNRAQYRGSTIAQELRTLVKEKAIIDIPIFLISADEKLHESLDKTSLDLFDGVISKNTIGSTGISFPDFIKALSAFAKGYDELNHQKNLLPLLDIKNGDILDSRFIDEFEKTVSYPNHVTIRFIKNEFLEKNTALINEDVLAARLGVDKSSPDWDMFKNEFLKPFIYTGILSGFYERWWWPLVDEWWNNKLSDQVSIRTLSATERVNIICKHKEGIKLKPQEKSEKSQSDKFWTVCNVRRTAMDTIDGFLIAGQDNNYPWQDKEYVCNEEALRPKYLGIWKSVSTTEKNRLQNLKDFYGKKEQRVRR